MTLEDETGTSRVIISPDFYDKNRMAVLNEKTRFGLRTGMFISCGATIQYSEALESAIH